MKRLQESIKQMGARVESVLDCDLKDRVKGCAVLRIKFSQYRVDGRAKVLGASRSIIFRD